MIVTAENLTDEQIREYERAMTAEHDLGQWNLARSGLSDSPLGKHSDLFTALREKLAYAINARKVTKKIP